MSAPQSYKNHSRFDPVFHFFLAPLSLLNIGLLFTWHVRHKDVYPHLLAWLVVMSIVFFVAVGKMRGYALRNQDRTIRLEEKLRFQALLPAELLQRSENLSMRQIIALRFASDAELAELVKRTLAEGLEPKAIKQSIQQWRPDLQRV